VFGVTPRLTTGSIGYGWNMTTELEREAPIEEPSS
jgi:hypothetical protein